MLEECLAEDEVALSNAEAIAPNSQEDIIKKFGL